MSFKELISKRYSVRSYKPDPISEELLEQVLEAACLAPTAVNKQPFKFIVIHTEGRQEELKPIYKGSFFTEAPILICACLITSQAWSRKYDNKNYGIVDVAIAMDHLILVATELGLGTCWIAAFNPNVARQVLNLPNTVEPIAFTPLGYPNDSMGLRVRKPLNDLIIYDKWQ
ncbi:hypothetical protein N752_30895 [Desulforamulus aquiferis]|nr:nitroreductase family protein [Desulforamulus aquiferis]RYD01404.1 hypothetical protein N752_30895 [Desulforamulus aquiferis]